MAWHKSLVTTCKKTEEVKTKVPPPLKERIKLAAIEDGLLEATWVREALEHVLTIREIKDRIKSHQADSMAG